MHFSLSNILSRPHLMFKRVNLLVEHKNQPNPWACRIIFQFYIAYNIFFLRPSGILLNPSYLSIVIQYHTVPTSNGHYNNNNIKDIPLHTQYLPSNERGTQLRGGTYLRFVVFGFDQTRAHQKSWRAFIQERSAE